MSKWYEQVLPEKGSNFISSRIRLARNWNEYAFPESLDMQQSTELISRLTYGLDDINSVENHIFRIMSLDKLGDVEKQALRDRRIMNQNMVMKKTPTGLMLSENEDTSILLNGDDHIRLQLLAPGVQLGNLYVRANKYDDYVNSRFNYAFDEKYGYLTAFPTSVGTGMKANIVMHLPTLARTEESRAILEGLSRFGVSIRGVYAKAKTNYGSLYDISNAKTLGVSEKEIIDLVTRVATQLNEQENKARQVELDRRYIDAKDEAYRAYGMLKYCRKLELTTGLRLLSNLMTGVRDGLVEFEKPISIYALILAIQPSNILTLAHKPIEKNEQEVMRAELVRKNLPEIKEA